MLPGGLAAHLVGFIGANLAFAGVYSLAVHFMASHVMSGAMPLWCPLTLIDSALGKPCETIGSALSVAPATVLATIDLAIVAAIIVAGIGLLRRGFGMVRSRA